jgi:hypothetical protein
MSSSSPKFANIILASHGRVTELNYKRAVTVYKVIENLVVMPIIREVSDFITMAGR